MRTHPAGLATLLLLIACEPVPLAADALTATTEMGSTGPRDAFTQAARVAGVPADLLIALAHVETGMQMVRGEEEFEGYAPAYGVMGLRGSQLETAAMLAGVSVEDMANHREENILGAALLLAEWADEMGVTSQDLDAWAPVAARYSGIHDAEAAAEYVHFEVYDLLGRGLQTEGLTVEARAVSPDFPSPSRVRNARMDDSSAIWSPSPNRSSRGGRKAEYVVIHTCEGSYSGCWGWLVNGSSGVSAHYVVNDAGTEVRQLVDESEKAWHVSANYDCSLNSGQDCANTGYGVNTLSIGIEHAGFASQSSWSPGLIQRSAELTCGITQRNGIPRDSYHIFGHGQIQPWNRTDPGPNWPWNDYLYRIQEACGDHSTTGGGSGSSGGSSGTGGSGSSGSQGVSSTESASDGPTGLPRTFVIDSNNGMNGSRYHIDQTGWTASSNVYGYYYTGYWWQRTSTSGTMAHFRFETDAEVCYQVEAWWPSATDRSPSATFLATDPSGGELARAVVNQQASGAKWNTLGHWRFPAGTNAVSLSSWGDGTYVVVADAIQLTESTACP